MSEELNKILNERQKLHGDALENFEKVGQIWAIMLDLRKPIQAWQVALMMDVFKSVRCLANPNHKDNWLDKQGYTKHGMDAWFNDLRA
jgi:hypothetical protein